MRVWLGRAVLLFELEGKVLRDRKIDYLEPFRSERSGWSIKLMLIVLTLGIVRLLAPLIR